jgi:hypothetical protein
MGKLQKNLAPTFYLLLRACAGAKRRQKRHKLLEVEPIEHPQEPLTETPHPSVGICHRLITQFTSFTSRNLGVTWYITTNILIQARIQMECRGMASEAR